MPKLKQREVFRIIDLYNKGLTYADITKLTGHSHNVIVKYVKKQRKKHNRNEYMELLTYLNQIEVFYA